LLDCLEKSDGGAAKQKDPVACQYNVHGEHTVSP
jgi:hypothetical protein